MDYQTYQSFGGKLSEQEFNSLLPNAETFVLTYIGSIVAYWLFDEAVERLKEKDELDKLIAAQIDFIEAVGGESVFYGENEFNLSSVSTSGFNYQMSKSNNAEDNVHFFKGIPISPIVDMKLNHLLRQYGFFYRGL